MMMIYFFFTISRSFRGCYYTRIFPWKIYNDVFIRVVGEHEEKYTRDMKKSFGNYGSKLE